MTGVTITGGINLTLGSNWDMSITPPPVYQYARFYDDFRYDATTTITNNGTTVTHDNDNSGYKSAMCPDGKSSGKYYFEMTVTSLPNGAGETAVIIGNIGQGLNQWGGIEGVTQGMYFVNDGRSGAAGYNGPNVGVWANGDVLRFKVDLDAKTVSYARNNGSFTSDIDISAMMQYDNTVFVFAGVAGPLASMTFNFGATPYAYDLPIGFGPWTATPRPASSRFWRYTKIEGTTYQSQITEVQLRTTSGGPSVLTGGTASAIESYPGYPPEYACDGLETTRWVTSWDYNWLTWWQYDLGAGNDQAIIQMTLQIWSSELNPPGYAIHFGEPTKFWITASTDGMTYYPVKYFTVPSEGPGSWQVFETKVFSW